MFVCALAKFDWSTQISIDFWRDLREAIDQAANVVVATVAENLITRFRLESIEKPIDAIKIS